MSHSAISQNAEINYKLYLNRRIMCDQNTAFSSADCGECTDIPRMKLVKANTTHRHTSNLGLRKLITNILKVPGRINYLPSPTSRFQVASFVAYKISD